MNKFLACFAVLRHGAALTDPALWKQRQNLGNALVGALGAVAALLPTLGVRLEFSHEDVLAVAGGIAALAGVFNAYLTTATSEKVGLPPKRDPGGDPGPERGGDGGPEAFPYRNLG